MFIAKDIKSENLKYIKFDESIAIRTIHGDSDTYHMKKVHFRDNEDKIIVKIEAFNNNPGQEMHLKDGEDIIGVYGHKNSYNEFTNLGFIVWTPHYD